jgi:hypothetical protein
MLTLFARRAMPARARARGNGRFTTWLRYSKIWVTSRACSTHTKNYWEDYRLQYCQSQLSSPENIRVD